MNDLNLVVFYGRVVSDAQIKIMPSGIKITNFSVANNFSTENQNGTFEDKASFFPLSIFGEYAEKMLPYLKKGQKVIIEGRLKQDRWEKNGQKRSSLAISVRKIQLVSNKKQAENYEEIQEIQEETSQSEIFPESDVIMDIENSEPNNEETIFDFE